MWSPKRTHNTMKYYINTVLSTQSEAWTGDMVFGWGCGIASIGLTHLTGQKLRKISLMESENESKVKKTTKLKCKDLYT